MTAATASPTPGLEAIIDSVCPKVCSNCGEDLPRPGEDCASCGEIPRLLREDAAEQFSQPGALAAKQAEHHREQAERLLGELVAEHLAADRALFIGGLRQALDRASADLTAALARFDQAEAPLKGLRDAEERLAGDVADAREDRDKFDLAVRKAERHKKGIEAIVHARRNLELADEELAKRQGALVAAQGARVQAEALLTGADAEVERLTQVRDYAARRLDAPPDVGMSLDTMKALAAPVLDLAGAVAPIRLDRPGMRFTSQDVAGNQLVAFVIGITAQLGMLTGLTSAERAAGVAAGREQAEAEQKQQPRVVGNTVVAPGAVNVHGGIIAPGWPAR